LDLRLLNLASKSNPKALCNPNHHLVETASHLVESWLVVLAASDVVALADHQEKTKSTPNVEVVG
jgi:hypothetical protein